MMLKCQSNKSKYKYKCRRTFNSYKNGEKVSEAGSQEQCVGLREM